MAKLDFHLSFRGLISVLTTSGSNSDKAAEISRTPGFQLSQVKNVLSPEARRSVIGQGVSATLLWRLHTRWGESQLWVQQCKYCVMEKSRYLKLWTWSKGITDGFKKEQKEDCVWKTGESYFMGTRAPWEPQSSLTTAGFDALVGPIRTVFVTVALPTLRDAHVRSRALEGLRAAGFVFWAKKTKYKKKNNISCVKCFTLRGLFLSSCHVL